MNKDKSSGSEKKQKSLSYFGLENFGESEISILNTVLNPNQSHKKKRDRDFGLKERENSENLEKSSRKSAPKNSKPSLHRSGNITLRRSFFEDIEQKTRLNNLKTEAKVPHINTAPRKTSTEEEMNNLRTARNREDSRFHLSNEESEKSCYEELTEQINSKVLDDSYLETRQFLKMRTEYLNIIIIGQSQVNKFSFIKHCYKALFDKNLIKNAESREISEYVHEFTHQNTRKIITFIHCKGYSKEFPIQKWYSLIKDYVFENIRNYQDIKRIFANEKRLQKETIIDCRVHLCLYFIQAPKPKLNEIIYLKKLQKILPIVPVLVGKDQEKKLNLEYVKSLKVSVLEELKGYDIEIVDFLENDINIKMFRNSLLFKMSPFFINQVNSKFNTETDLNSLTRIVTAGVSNYFKYKTEVLFSTNVEKLNQNKEFKKKKNNEESVDKNLGVGVGFAIGLGIFGAFVALKNKLF